MENKEKILIMLVGKTHTGKTTFAKKIESKAKNIITLEADPIAVFMKEHFPALRENDDLNHNSSFNNVSLKYRTFLSFVEFALALGRPIILSNSNMWAKGREMVFVLCKKFNYKTIGVYFDFSEKVLVERVENTDRSMSVLRVSKDFSELIINQRTRMEPPNSSEFDAFYVAKSPQEIDNLEEIIVKELT